MKALARGLSRRKAALSAGYSESTADKVVSRVETPDVKAVFRDLLQRAVPPPRLVAVAQDGLSAMKTEYFTKDGQVTDQRDTIAWAERRQYAQMVAEWAGYVSTEEQATSSVHVLAMLQAQPIDLAQPTIDLPTDPVQGPAQVK